MKSSRYVFGIIGSIVFFIFVIIYAPLRCSIYYQYPSPRLGISLRFFIDYSLDGSLHALYIFIFIGIILIAVELIKLEADYGLTIAKAAATFAIMAAILSFIFYPYPLFPSSNFSTIKFGLYSASSVLLFLFFLTYGSTLRQHAKNIRNEKLRKTDSIKITGTLTIIFGIFHMILTIVIIAFMANNLFTRWMRPSNLMGIILFSIYGGSIYDIQRFFFIMDNFHFFYNGVISAYFIQILATWLPLAVIGIINAVIFGKEFKASPAEVSKIKVEETEIKEKIKDEIDEIANRYSGVTFQRLSTRVGYSSSSLKPLVKEMISEGMLKAAIRGNLIVFGQKRIESMARKIPERVMARQSLRPTPKKFGLIAKRGGQIQGGKYLYKIKVENNTYYNITDLAFQIVSYPQDSIELVGEPYREISKLDKGGIVSPTFEFLPSKDCIVGTIHSTVTYIDHLNQPHTINVEPFTISMICGLLSAKKIEIGEFTQITDELLDFEKTGEEITIPYNAKLIFDKLKEILPDHNFWLVTKPEERTLGDTFIGEFNGFAEGKYNKRGVGLKVTISGEIDGDSCVGMIEAYAQDGSMLPPLISELSKRMIIWNCKQCDAPIDKVDVENLLRNKPIECKYCGFVITKLLH